MARQQLLLRRQLFFGIFRNQLSKGGALEAMRSHVWSDLSETVRTRKVRTVIRAWNWANGFRPN